MLFLSNFFWLTFLCFLQIILRSYAEDLPRDLKTSQFLRLMLKEDTEECWDMWRRKNFPLKNPDDIDKGATLLNGKEEAESEVISYKNEDIIGALINLDTRLQASFETGEVVKERVQKKLLDFFTTHYDEGWREYFSGYYTLMQKPPTFNQHALKVKTSVQKAWSNDPSKKDDLMKEPLISKEHALQVKTSVHKAWRTDYSKKDDSMKKPLTSNSHALNLNTYPQFRRMKKSVSYLSNYIRRPEKANSEYNDGLEATDGLKSTDGLEATDGLKSTDGLEATDGRESTDSFQFLFHLAYDAHTYEDFRRNAIIKIEEGNERLRQKEKAILKTETEIEAQGKSDEDPLASAASQKPEEGTLSTTMTRSGKSSYNPERRRRMIFHAQQRAQKPPVPETPEAEQAVLDPLKPKQKLLKDLEEEKIRARDSIKFWKKMKDIAENYSKDIDGYLSVLLPDSKLKEKFHEILVVEPGRTNPLDTTYF
ncbi:hypothetical protein CROQUDRAFT_710335 [Cronartium quercuum f. sp. fusiforme G11]|uniref:Uncharacterized protein n=1 Tax=Cronartium quercuum f. sp. fusiforme G11 TaxID=708437 RepID=A0A9P6TB22_9BASI|nr:hypothetical protein CROQUDRAFT_710335 [Cronartium quercuum f. sp. fusiforme G11]